MESTTPSNDGARPGEASPHRDSSSSSVDVLASAASTLIEVEAGPAARVVLAQVLSATLVAFTRTRSVRDPLPDTAAGSAEEALAVLAGIDQLRSSLSAMDATWQVAAERRIGRADAHRGLPTTQQGKGANSEIALARRISPAASSFSLASARRLVQHMPGTVDTLWEGAVTAQQASTVAGALSTASPETCRRIDELIEQDPQTLQGKGHKRLRSDVEEMVQHLEPETSRERAERAARERHVTMTPLADGMARVTAVLRGIDAVGMMQALHSGAGSLRAAGEKTSTPALEADLLVDAVLTRGTSAHPAPSDEAPHAPRRPRPQPGLDVGIVISDTALLGRDDTESAHLEGYGIIPAHIVRDSLLGRPPGYLRPDEDEHPDELVSAFYRRLYTNPATAELVAMESRSRAFPAGLARMIRWRDTTCRTPWCNAMIRQSDHVIPFHRGGPTSYANGQGLCVRCNLLKEHGLWVLVPLTGENAPNPVSTQPSDTTPDTLGTPGTPSSSPAASTPPTAWFWTSPHGAQGVSWTPRCSPRHHRSSHRARRRPPILRRIRRRHRLDHHGRGDHPPRVHCPSWKKHHAHAPQDPYPRRRRVRTHRLDPPRRRRAPGRADRRVLRSSRRRDRTRAGPSGAVRARPSRSPGAGPDDLGSARGRHSARR
nr:HNH endonuclease signature motif containing protein [Brachybacterium avium]